MTSWIDIDSLPWTAVLRGCLSGDEGAWTQLVTTIGPRIADLYGRMGCAPETTQDLAQSFFLKLLESDRRILREFDQDRGVPFPLYLRVIAVRVHIDWTRTREANDRRRWVPLGEAEDRPAGRDPSEELVAKEILAGLHELQHRDQVALELRSVGARYEEIARVVGMSVGGVSATISRARLRLRDLLAQESPSVPIPPSVHGHLNERGGSDRSIGKEPV